MGALGGRAAALGLPVVKVGISSFFSSAKFGVRGLNSLFATWATPLHLHEKPSRGDCSSRVDDILLKYNLPHLITYAFYVLYSYTCAVLLSGYFLSLDRLGIGM